MVRPATTGEWATLAVAVGALLAVVLVWVGPQRPARRMPSTVAATAARPVTFPPVADVGAPERDIRPLSARNLFRFAPAGTLPLPSEEPAPARVRPVLAPAAAPAGPPMRLIGMAEDDTPARPELTAIISRGGDLFYVKSGDRLAGRLLVVDVVPDAVQLRSDDGLVQRLGLGDTPAAP